MQSSGIDSLKLSFFIVFNVLFLFWMSLANESKDLLFAYISVMTGSKLSDIHNWSNGNREIIELGYSSISGDTVLDSVIQLINSRVKQEYKDYPHIDSFIKNIGGENNAFTMELNPNGIFNNSELLQQFPKIFSWLGQAWIQAVNALGTFPNINKIQNIIVEFNIQITGDLKLSTSVVAKIVPIKTTITFNTNTLSNIVWYFSKDLQNEKSYTLGFENSTDNLKPFKKRCKIHKSRLYSSWTKKNRAKYFIHDKRYWNRHKKRTKRKNLYKLLPGRHFHLPQIRRNRTWTFNQQKSCAFNEWKNRRKTKQGRRFNFLVYNPWKVFQQGLIAPFISIYNPFCSIVSEYQECQCSS